MSGSRSNPLNYRPVSLTLVCCKVLERVTVSQVVAFLEDSGVLSDGQFRFRVGKSMEDQLLMSYGTVADLVDDLIVFDVVFLDYSKVFDVTLFRCPNWDVWVFQVDCCIGFAVFWLRDECMFLWRGGGGVVWLLGGDKWSVSRVCVGSTLVSAVHYSCCSRCGQALFYCQYKFCFMVSLFTSHIRQFLNYYLCVWNVGYLGDLRQLKSVERQWTKEIDWLVEWTKKCGSGLCSCFLSWGGCCTCIWWNVGRFSIVLWICVCLLCLKGLLILAHMGILSSLWFFAVGTTISADSFILAVFRFGTNCPPVWCMQFSFVATRGPWWRSWDRYCMGFASPSVSELVVLLVFLTVVCNCWLSPALLYLTYLAHSD